MRDGSNEILAYWGAGYCCQYAKVAFFIYYGLYTAFTVYFETTTQLF